MKTTEITEIQIEQAVGGTYFHNFNKPSVEIALKNKQTNEIEYIEFELASNDKHFEAKQLFEKFNIMNYWKQYSEYFELSEDELDESDRYFKEKSNFGMEFE